MTIQRSRGPTRAFIWLWLAVLLGSVAPAQTAGAQSVEKLKRIGYLSSGARASGFHESFQSGLRDLGWIVDQNVAIEYRFAEGKNERLPQLAAELVRLRVDLIVAQPTTAVLAAKNATSTIPIVMVNVGDPDRIGLVDSLAHPGGNVTGVAYGVGLESIVKGLEFLKVAVPGVRRVAVLSNPANPNQPYAIKDVKAAAQSLGLQLLLLEARDADQFDGVFAAISRDRADALFVVAESFFILHRAQLAERALKQRLVSVHGARENVEAGGLMSYGPILSQNSRRAASFADRILKGAKPAELPVEQPTKFELVVNLRTARALGLSIPQSLLLRADHVIE